MAYNVNFLYLTKDWLLLHWPWLVLLASIALLVMPAIIATVRQLKGQYKVLGSNVCHYLPGDRNTK